MPGLVKPFIGIVVLVLSTPCILGRDECEEFSQNRGLFKLCKKVESQKSQSSVMFNKVLEIEPVQSWFLANKEALETALEIATIFSVHKKVQIDKDHDQDMKLSTIEGKLEAVKEHFYGVLKEQALSEAIFDKKISLESDALKEEIKSIKKSVSDLESRLSSSVISLETKETITSEKLANISESVTELNSTLRQKMKAVVESQLLSPVAVEMAGYASSDKALEVKLAEISLSLSKQMTNLRSQSVADLFNLTTFVEDRLATMSTNMETRLNDNVVLVRDSMYNASSAFLEDLEVLRQLFTNTSTTVAYLSGKELVSVRAIEELKSSARRQDAILQTMSKQVQDLQHSMQDQLQTVRNTFQMTLVEFYQKISDRQNQMMQRLSSVVDEVGTVKTRVRNILAGIVVVPSTTKQPTSQVQTDEYDSTDDNLNF